MSTAAYNERGDLLAGIFGPITFLWLVVGYLVQLAEMSQQREQLIMQNQAILHDIEVSKRKYDPYFILELSIDRVVSLENIGVEIAKQLLVYYIDHTTREKHIIFMANALPPKKVLHFDLKPPLMIPRSRTGMEDRELMILYDTQVDNHRCQRFGFEDRTNTDKDIGWQIGAGDQIPDFFMDYK